MPKTEPNIAKLSVYYVGASKEDAGDSLPYTSFYDARDEARESDENVYSAYATINLDKLVKEDESLDVAFEEMKRHDKSLHTSE